MERLKNLILDSEDRLLRRIIHLAHTAGYTQCSSTFVEAWRVMVRGLSESLITFLSDINGDLGAEVAAFVVHEAELHQKRGVRVTDFISLLKICRQAYRELLGTSSTSATSRYEVLAAHERYFDHLEVAALTAVAETDQDTLVRKMQAHNLELTLEKNRFLTIFENVPNPVIYLNEKNELYWLNLAAKKLLAAEMGCWSDLALGNEISLPKWLAAWLNEFRSAAQDVAKYRMDLETTGGLRHFELKMSRMADAGGDCTGTIVILTDLTDYQQAKAELQRAYLQLQQLFRSVPDGLVVVSADYTIVEANEKLAELFGLSQADLLGRKCFDVWDAPQCHSPGCILKLVAGGMGVIEREQEIATKDGHKRHALVSSAPLFDADGAFLGMVTSVKDITERKKAEEGLENYRQLLQQAQDIILFVSKDGRILDVNEAACKEYGYSREELLRLNIRDLREPATLHLYRQQMQQAFETGIVMETIHRRKDGRAFPVEVSSRRVMVGGEEALLSIIRNITERKQAQEEIKYLSFHDKLTGLYNWAYLEKQLSGELKNVVPCSIIMGDMNGLKIANDAFGHRAGDKLLVEMAAILRQVCRSGDIIARTGGDEFVMVLPGADEAATHAVAERIKTRCAQSIFQPLPPSISLGLATRTTTDQSLFETLQEAETRMYRRKLLEADSARSFSIQSLQRTLYEKSTETREHTERLRVLVKMLAQKMELSTVLQDELDLLAMLHDIGKIPIPDDILNKPGKLTAEEWEIMKRHSEIGYRIAKTSPELAPIAEYILAHHERWDGQGYPRGLAGEEIPLAARILAVADAFDVMVNERPYKSAFSTELAIKELKRHAGTQFDPHVVTVFLSLLDKNADAIGA